MSAGREFEAAIEASFHAGASMMRVLRGQTCLLHDDRDGHLALQSVILNPPEWLASGMRRASREGTWYETFPGMHGLDRIEVKVSAGGGGLDIKLVPDTATADEMRAAEARKLAQVAERVARESYINELMRTEPDRPLDPARLASLMDAWRATGRPAAELVVVPAGSPGSVGLYGGHPEWPASAPWPRGRDCTVLGFVAQVDCSAAPALPGIPGHGVLSFFLDLDSYDDEAHAVAWHPRTASLAEPDPRVARLPPLALALGPRRVSYRGIHEVMGSRPDLDLLWWGPERDVAEDEEAKANMASHMGGWERFLGSDNDPGETVILKLESTGDTLWGDAGSLVFAARSDDLDAGRLDMTRCVTDST